MKRDSTVLHLILSNYFALMTDSALRATSIAVEHETNIYKRNRLSVRRDSLQARYEALCGVVRMIHLKMKKEK